MIRVLQVVTHMNRGGLETMLMNYYRHIDRSRIQFDFLTHREYDGDYGAEIRDLGGIIFHLPRLNPYSVRYRKLLHSFFAEHPEYLIVHVHQDCLSSVVLKEAYIAGIPVRIAHSHSSNQDRNLKLFLKLYYRQFIPKYATKLLACGESAGKWMFQNHKYTVLNNAIDAKKYTYDIKKRIEIRKTLCIPENVTVFGHVGRFSKPKNHLGLIRFFSALLKHIDARLILVGDGELRRRIENQVAEEGISNKVIFLGLRDDVDVIMQAMDVFVFPSLYEGVPLTLIEAQAAGLPCIVSDRVPKESSVTDLVEFQSLKELPNKWVQLALSMIGTKRNNTLEKISKAGFDIEENANRLHSIYIEEVGKICQH